MKSAVLALITALHASAILHKPTIHFIILSRVLLWLGEGTFAIGIFSIDTVSVVLMLGLLNWRQFLS